MARPNGRIVSGMFAGVACIVTALAAWASYRAAHSALGMVGGLLTALAAAMIVGAPFYIATVLIWTRDPRASDPPARRAGTTPRRRS